MPVGGACVKLVIEGAPRTKKNGLRRIKRGRRIFTVPSAAHEAWEAIAIPQLVMQWRAECRRQGTSAVPMALPVIMAAYVYRDRDVGDLLNFLAAVSDVLERAGVVADDRLIVSVDGSRLMLDRARPRVEVELTWAPPA
jgi:Holliday junction resolvase RusA-like endonuclease